MEKKTISNEINQSNNLDWRDIEKIAAILEKSLTPIAKVGINKRLPVLGKQRYRQCDIVITYGEPPRHTITIVEVQKRLEKPEINTFHGWIRKMQEVGAQHLICVTTSGYPKSIIDEVAEDYGSTVHLATLSEIMNLKLGILNFIFPYIIHTNHHFTKISANPKVRVTESTHVEGLSVIDKVFSINNDENLYSIDELFPIFLLKRLEEGLKEKGIENCETGQIEIDGIPEGMNLWFHFGDEKYQIKTFPISGEFETIYTKIPLTVFSYNQEFIDGELAWIVVAKGAVADKEISIQIVFRPDSNGVLRLVSARVPKDLELRLVFSNDKSVLENYLANHH